MNDERTNGHASVRYLNGVLTVIAVLLGLLVVQRGIEPGAERNAAFAASGQNKPGHVGFPNAAEQRKRLIASVQQLDARLKQIESGLLKGTLSVKVVEMPPVKISE